MSKNVYEIITNEIVKKLEKVNPNDWEKPWFNIGISPFNAISKKDYRGINYLTLGNNGHESKAYASYKQWQDKDCQVKKGEKSHIAVFWKLNEYENNEGENKKAFCCDITAFSILNRLRGIMPARLSKRNLRK